MDSVIVKLKSDGNLKRWLFFYAPLAVWFFLSVLDMSLFSGMLHMNISACVCLALLFLGELIASRETKFYMAPTLISVLFLLIAFNAHDLRIVYSIAFIIAARNYNLETIMKVSLAAIACGVCFVFASMLIGIIPNYITPDGRGRMYLGFRYALFPSQFVFAMTCIVVYLKRNDLSLFLAAILFLSNLFIYLLTDSRLSFGLSTILIILALTLQSMRTNTINTGTLSYLFALIYIVGALTSITLVIQYSANPEVMSSINKLLGNRLSLGSSAISTYGIPAFGQHIEFIGNGLDETGNVTPGAYNYVDLSYIKLLVEFGPLPTIAFVALMTIACFYARKNNEPFLLLVLVIIGLHCIIDDLSLNLFYNPFLFTISIALASIQNKKNAVTANRMVLVR